MVTASAFAPVAITTRSGFDESVHFGAVVGLGKSGEVEYAIGDPDVQIYPRSSNKPLQAVAMLRAGLRVRPELLAVACASHDGSPMHVDAVMQLLAGCGLTAAELANTPSLPLAEEARRAVLCAGHGPSAVLMNCSGKHAAMLATCVHNGWSHDATYLDPAHPLQSAITATIDELSGQTHAHIGVDGCGAPAHVLTLVGLARAFRAVAAGGAGDAGAEVYAAMTNHPEMVGGRRSDVTLLMQRVPTLMAKDGADGVFAAALPDGRAVALKIADGGDRARAPAMLAALIALGVDVVDAQSPLEEPIMGHGRPVGRVRAVDGRSP